MQFRVGDDHQHYYRQQWRTREREVRHRDRLRHAVLRVTVRGHPRRPSRRRGGTVVRVERAKNNTTTHQNNKFQNGIFADTKRELLVKGNVILILDV